MSGLTFMAFDLGAESGRAFVGRLEGEKLAMTEVHRFANEPVLLPDGLHWDFLRLCHEIEAGLTKAGREHGREFDGIAVDTWGVDFGLLGKDDVLLGEPYHYRDHRTDGILPEAFRLVPREEIYARTGIQFMPINTLYQLLAMRLAGSPLLEMARALLFIPDLFTFFLSGVKVNEFTIATTSQCLDVANRVWAGDLLARFGLPVEIFGRIVEAGTPVGPLRASLSSSTGVTGQVIAGAAHDTAAAVAAIPATDPDFAYISCGTWSLVGVEISRPLIDARALAADLTNEGGVAGTIRLLKNVMGLWLVQECRRSWVRAGRDYDYAALTALAAEAPAFKMLFDPDNSEFLNPPDMPSAIAAYAARTGQAIPGTVGEFVRAALESLALKYRFVLETLEKVLDRRIPVVHVVGGGTKNELLCRFTAEATGRPVIAGPVEATAAGNLLVQAMALGRLGGLDDIRRIVRASFPLRTYTPSDTGAWEEAYGRFLDLVSSSG
ncbi:MAG: rhamnulokinase [Firmicutes bacterium]|nr:rhamnulokinase [Bacillota bacterium]